MTAHPRADARIPRTHETPEVSGIGRRLRVGLITHLDHSDDLDVVYDENLTLIRELERLGYDSVWTATRHFHSGSAGLPSPFAFYGAAAAQTSTIGLGTAVLPIIVDDPVRVAEEVAVLDYISKGRLQLGIGKGVPSDAYHAFARWGSDRETDFGSKVEQLHWALSGGTVPDTSTSIWPPNNDLRGRIYHGTSTWETIRRAARLGDGFILERFGNGDERTPDGRAAFQRRQSDSILEYRSEFERSWGQTRSPYVVVSRTAWPAESREAALREVSAASEKWNAQARKVGRLPVGLSSADELISDNVIWGTPEQLADDLLADASIGRSDEIVLGLHPGSYTLDQAIEKASILIDELYPRLQQGWLEARRSLQDDVHDYAKGAVISR